jgi:hypothetical protein
LEKIEYEGTVFVLDHKYPEPLVDHSVKKLQELGIKKDDMKLTDSPENPKVGSIVVEIFPYHLDIAQVRTIRNDSFISGTLMTLELSTDAEGNYID